MNTDKVTTYLGLVKGLLALLFTAGVLPPPFNFILGGLYAAGEAAFGYFTNKPSHPVGQA